MDKHSTLVNFLDSFIPLRIRENPHTTPLIQVQARILIAVLGFSILVPFLGMIIFIMLQATTEVDFTLALISMITVLILLMLQHLLFQASGNLYRTGLAYSIQFFVSVMLSVCITGGWHSPVLMLLLCTPVMSLLTTNYRTAVICSVIALFSGLSLWVLDINSIALLNIMPPETYSYTLAVIWFMASAVMLLLLTAYEWLMEIEQ